MNVRVFMLIGIQKSFGVDTNRFILMAIASNQLAGDAESILSFATNLTGGSVA